MTNCYGTNAYEYDSFGNLKKVTLSSGKRIEYKVDAFNRRFKKLVDGDVAEYYLWYDQFRLAAVLNPDKSPKLIYVYGSESSNVPGYVIKNGMTYKIIHDPGTQSVRYVVDVENALIVQEYEYDEHGNIMKDTNPGFQSLGYAGGLLDPDTRFVRFGYRDYDPTIGRWTTKDPIGFLGGDTNLYAYVGGDPMSYVDPSGLKVGDWWDLPANFNRAKEIALEELAKRPTAHNNYDDGLRHSEWMRRTTVETNSFTSFVAGWGHEIDGLFNSRRKLPINQYLQESWMDVQNNSIGRKLGASGQEMCPNNLISTPGNGSYGW